MSETPPSVAAPTQLRQRNAQCLLLQGWSSLRAHSLSHVPQLGDGSYVQCYAGDPTAFVSKLSASPNLHAFMDSTGAQQSLLQPQLEFYITETAKDGSVTDTPVVFSDYVSGDKMVEFAGLRSEGSLAKITKPSDTLGTNVGVKSFEWRFDNRDVGEYVVKATLELHFGSLVELLNEAYLEFIFTTGIPDIASRTNTKKTAKQAQQEIVALEEELGVRKGLMAAAASNKQSSAPTKRSFKNLKAVVGWSLPDTATEMISPELRTAVEQTQRTLYLGLAKYALDFMEEGQVNLTLEYYASIDSFFVNQRSNVLKGDALKSRADREMIMVESLSGGLFGQTSRIGEVATAVASLGRSSATSYARDGAVWPEGYIEHRHNADASLGLRMWVNQDRSDVIQAGHAGTTELGTAAAFTVSLEGVQGEIDWLTDKIKLERMKLAAWGEIEHDRPGALWSGTETTSQMVTRFEGYLSAAIQVYEEAQDQLRARKYSSFMQALMESGKVFVARASYGDVNRRSPDRETSQSLLLKTTPNPTSGAVGSDRHSVLFKKQKLNRLAQAAVLKKQDETTAAAIERLGLIDPAPDSKSWEDGQAVPLVYIRLADLIAVAMKNFSCPKTFKVMLGSFVPAQMGLIHPHGSQQSYSLGDIPISVDYFGQWYVDNIISPQRDTYIFRRFLQDLLNSLVKPLLNDICVDVTKPVSMGFTNIPVNPLTLSSNALLTSADMENVALGLSRIAHGTPHQTITAVFCRQVNERRSGNREEDIRDGIYHFYVGADRGIQKSFSFTERTIPYIKAQNISNANRGSHANILILPQDVEIKMVGSGFFPNGSTIYVNAEMGLGRAAAQKLALGGYYTVIRSRNRIEPGVFETTVECIWNASPRG